MCPPPPHQGKMRLYKPTQSGRTGRTGCCTTRTPRCATPTQFDEHLPLQVDDLPGGVLQGAAEPHLGPQQLHRVADHVVDVDGERVVLGPNVGALLPPDVALRRHRGGGVRRRSALRLRWRGRLRPGSR